MLIGACDPRGPGLELGFLFNPLYVDTSTTSPPRPTPPRPRDGTEGADEPASAAGTAADRGGTMGNPNSPGVEVWKQAALKCGTVLTWA